MLLQEAGALGQELALARAQGAVLLLEPPAQAHELLDARFEALELLLRNLGRAFRVHASQYSRPGPRRPHVMPHARVRAARRREGGG